MPIIEEVATITAKGQTTVPKAVRQALGVGHGDRIAFRVDEHGVTVHRANAEREQDPALESFLNFLARDIERHPERVTAFPPALVQRITELTKGMEVDLDAPIEGDVEL
jgi:antitoxin PrlF